MISEYDVREKIAAVLVSRLSIVEFARWIMANSWNMHADSSSSAVSLASKIHALLAERDDYSLNDTAFINELRDLYDNVSVLIDADEFVPKPEILPMALNKTGSVDIVLPHTRYISRPINPSPQLAAVPVRL